MRRKLVGVVFVILGLMIWAGGGVATPAGTVAVVSGSCTDHGHVLKAGDAVQIGDTLEVPGGSHLKLQMVDGSVISVAPGSSITVERYNIASSGRDVKLSLTQGLLRAQVSSVTGPSTFDVSTAAGTASVGSASADWFIRTQTGLAQAGVLAGKIDLTSTATGESVSIPAHWGTRLEAGRSPVPPRNWTQAEFEEVTHSTQ
jgi:hypothetical protein